MKSGHTINNGRLLKLFRYVVQKTLDRRVRCKAQGDVIIESVVNEEHSGNGTLACVARGIIADAVIVVDTTDFEVLAAGGGSLYWQVKVQGEPKHTAERWVGRKKVGVSAVEKIPEVIRSLVELEAKLNKSSTQSYSPFSLAIGKISGGAYETLTAKECAIRGNVYFAENIGTVRKAMELMREAISKASMNDAWLKRFPPELVFLHHRNPSSINFQHPIIEVIGHAGERALNFKPIPRGGFMPADQGFYINQANVPAVVFGPGKPTQAHQIDEYINVNDFINGVKVLALIVYEWCR